MTAKPARVGIVIPTLARTCSLKKFEKEGSDMYPKVWTDVSLRLEGIFHEMDI